jgi:hypothetical protein
MVEIAGIDITRVVWVIIALAASFLIARIVSRILARIFEKTPFPEDIEKLDCEGFEICGVYHRSFCGDLFFRL